MFSLRLHVRVGLVVAKFQTNFCPLIDDFLANYLLQTLILDDLNFQIINSKSMDISLRICQHLQIPTVYCDTHQLIQLFDEPTLVPTMDVILTNNNCTKMYHL